LIGAKFALSVKVTLTTKNAIAVGLKMFNLGSEISESMTTAEKIDLTDGTNTSPEILAYLSQDKEGYVRFWVADHSNTSSETLAKLSQDEDEDVRDRARLNLKSRS
jgi:hypothetical protein